MESLDEPQTKKPDCPDAPIAPPGVSVDQNIKSAQSKRNEFGLINQASNLMNSMPWFYNQVRSRGPWDYKRSGSQYENFGNFNYGATGAAMGIPESALLRGAGWASTHADSSRSAFWGNWWGSAPYGDDPADQAQIKAGIDYYKAKSGGCK